jgi:hypothetical protein
VGKRNVGAKGMYDYEMAYTAQESPDELNLQVTVKNDSCSYRRYNYYFGNKHLAVNQIVLVAYLRGIFRENTVGFSRDFVHTNSIIGIMFPWYKDEILLP